MKNYSTPDDLGRDLVRPVLTGILDLGVDRLDPILFACSLRHGQLVFIVAREVFPTVRLVHVRAGNLIFQAKVDTHRIQAEFQLRFVFDFALQVDVPAAPVVLGKAALFDVAESHAREPQAKETPAVPDAVADELDAIRLERYPAQRTLAATPGQTTLAELLALFRKLRTDALDGMGLQTEFSAASSRKLMQIVSRQPLVVSSKGKHGNFVQ